MASFRAAYSRMACRLGVAHHLARWLDPLVRHTRDRCDYGYPVMAIQYRQVALSGNNGTANATAV